MFAVFPCQFLTLAIGVSVASFEKSKQNAISRVFTHTYPGGFNFEIHARINNKLVVVVIQLKALVEID